MFAWLYGLISMELLGVSRIDQRGARQLEEGLRHFDQLLNQEQPFNATHFLPGLPYPQTAQP